MRQFKFILILTVILALVLVSTVPGCKDKKQNETIAPSDMMLCLEQDGTWNYSFFSGMEEFTGYYDPEGGLFEAITINTANINGKDYLVMSFDPLSSGHNSRLFIFDVEDPVSPRLISSITHSDNERKSYLVRDIAIQDGILYAGLFGDKGLWIVDISDPASPADMGVYPVETNDNMLVSGDYLYSSGQLYNGIIVCDVSEIENIKEINRLDIPTRDCRLEMSANLLFLGIKNTLTIYDISSPGKPEKLADLEMSLSGKLSTEIKWSGHTMDWSDWAHINDIQAYGDYVYVAFGAGQVRIIDISSPESPVEITTVGTGGFAVSLTADNDLLYLTKSDYEGRKIQLVVLDISEPANPRLVDSFITESDFILGGVTFSFCWISPQITGDFILVPGMRKLDVFRLTVDDTSQPSEAVNNKSAEILTQSLGSDGLDHVRPYLVIGERDLANDNPERSVGLWLITSENTTDFEERAQTVIQAVLDLYSLYERDYTSVILIPEDGVEINYYASASFAADGKGAAGMTGSAPAVPLYWKIRSSDFVLSEKELVITRLWFEKMQDFPQKNPLSSCSYDEDALKQYIAGTLGISVAEVNLPVIDYKEYKYEVMP